MSLSSHSASGDAETSVPFSSAEAAWFWFIETQMARSEGARLVSGAGLFPRPCEPVDICREVERLYRGRRLLIDHIKVLKHYGVRLTSPDPRHPKEVRAHYIWAEAMERIEDALVRKGIVASTSFPRSYV